MTVPLAPLLLGLALLPGLAGAAASVELPGAISQPSLAPRVQAAVQSGAAVASAAPATVIVSEADDGRSLNLRRGEQLRVVLGETAGTGYQWEIERLDRRLLRPEGRTTWQDPGPPAPPGHQAPVGLVGGPLQVSFLFRAVAVGEGELRLRHWRAWEGPGSVDRTLRLRVRVVS